MAYLLYPSYRMELRNQVGLQEVVEALNVEPPSPDEDLRFAERYAAAAGHLPRKETRPFTAAWLSYKLRGYVDAWLQTGRHADGREFPGKRELSGSGYWAVAEHLRQYPPEVGLSPQAGLTVSVGDTTGHPIGPGKLYEAVEAEARRLLTGLMASEQKQCLCKCACAGCGRYFLRAKPRRVYKQGTFCFRSHQMRAGALALTRNRRHRAAAELIELAAQQLLKWKVKTAAWAEDGRQKRRLAGALSQQMPRNLKRQANRREVKVNWVTRHRHKIEQKRVQTAKERKT